ncbi:MAG: nucleotidyltransferase family protein [Candidatus Eremiobacteraeota bacterium]|nr:nucleotidyltransferase family protein [Candidatus Eremiobacteraeota bacterium]
MSGAPKEPIPAVITAGGLISGGFASEAGTAIKAMVRIGERTLLEGTIEALKESGVVSAVALVAPGELEGACEARSADAFIEADHDGVENIRKALTHYSQAPRVLFCTSDLPFINGAAVRDFVARSPEHAVVTYPVFSKDEIDPAIRPGVPSYLSLKEGLYTGGSVFCLKVAPCLGRIDEIGKAFRARKSPLAMARILGLKIILKFLLGSCSLDDIVARVERIMGGACALIRGCDAGITVDIDDLHSYHFALEYRKKFP